MAPTLHGFYVSFSGESATPIANIYALSPKGEVVSKAVLDPAKAPYKELRGMAIGPDHNFYVAEAYKNASVIMKFSGTPSKGSSTLKFLGEFVTPSASAGLSHPYQLMFSAEGDLFVASQDTNVVTAFYGPTSKSPGKPKPNSKFLTERFVTGAFNPGTFVPAHVAKPGAPRFTPVSTDHGGLSFVTVSAAPVSPGGKPGKPTTHSVRGLAFDRGGNLYVADEANDRVAVFDKAGELLGVIKGSKNHLLSTPVALCFDGSKKLLYIGSPGNRSLFTYDVSGVAKQDFKAKGLIIGADALEKLSGVAVDPGGAIYTGSRKTNTVQKWSADGASHAIFAGPFPDTPEQIIAAHAPIVGA
jgi:DNA-binding beta-propeller fold protein YncE